MQARIFVQSSHADFTINPVTGAILTRQPQADGDDMSFIQRFDIEEWRKRNGGIQFTSAILGLRSIDILEIGYWYGDNQYEPPEPDFLQEIEKNMEQALPA